MKGLLKLKSNFIDFFHHSEPTLPLHTYPEAIIGEWLCVTSCDGASPYRTNHESTPIIYIDTYLFLNNETGIWMHNSNYDEQQCELFNYSIHSNRLFTRNCNEPTTRTYDIRITQNHLYLTSEFKYQWQYHRKQASSSLPHSTF